MPKDPREENARAVRRMREGQKRYHEVQARVTRGELTPLEGLQELSKKKRKRKGK